MKPKFHEFTDAITGHKVAISPTWICTIEPHTYQGATQTVIHYPNYKIRLEEDYQTVVSRLTNI